jgi:hypothetical protein
MVFLRKDCEWLTERKCFESVFLEICHYKVRRNCLVRLRAFALYRANGCSGQPITGVYRYEHVVIGPANYSYDWVALVKEHCTAMALRVFIPMPQGGSRKGGACGVWFSEPAKKELVTFYRIAKLVDLPVS